MGKAYVELCATYMDIFFVTHKNKEELEPWKIIWRISAAINMTTWDGNTRSERQSREAAWGNYLNHLHSLPPGTQSLRAKSYLLLTINLLSHGGRHHQMKRLIYIPPKPQTHTPYQDDYFLFSVSSEGVAWIYWCQTLWEMSAHLFWSFLNCGQ